MFDDHLPPRRTNETTRVLENNVVSGETKKPCHDHHVVVACDWKPSAMMASSLKTDAKEDVYLVTAASIIDDKHDLFELICSPTGSPFRYHVAFVVMRGVLKDLHQNSTADQLIALGGYPYCSFDMTVHVTTDGKVGKETFVLHGWGEQKYTRQQFINHVAHNRVAEAFFDRQHEWRDFEFFGCAECKKPLSECKDPVFGRMSSWIPIKHYNRESWIRACVERARHLFAIPADQEHKLIKRTLLDLPDAFEFGRHLSSVQVRRKILHEIGIEVPDRPPSVITADS